MHSASRCAGDHRRGLVDERADRGDPAGADDLRAGDQRAQPVRQVDQLPARRRPGNRYLLPPEKPTTSCGNTGLTMSVTSCSTTARLTRTWAVWRSRPPDSSAIRSAPIVPTSANVGRIPPGVVQHGHRRIAVGQAPRRRSRGGRPAACSLIAAWVPSATSTVSRLTRPCSASWIADISSGSGQLRVPSGTSTHTLRPSRCAAASWSCTNARISSAAENVVWAADLRYSAWSPDRVWIMSHLTIGWAAPRRGVAGGLPGLADSAHDRTMTAPRAGRRCCTRTGCFPRSPASARSPAGCTTRCVTCR